MDELLDASTECTSDEGEWECNSSEALTAPATSWDEVEAAIWDDDVEMLEQHIRTHFRHVHAPYRSGFLLEVCERRPAILLALPLLCAWVGGEHSTGICSPHGCPAPPLPPS